EARAQYIKGLKNANEQQRLFFALYEKETRTAQEEKAFALLVKAERIAQKAQEAKAKAVNFIQAEKKLAAKLERKKRDHELYQSAGLLILAGLVETRTGKPIDDPAALLGALISLNAVPRDHPKWLEWQKAGVQAMQSKKFSTSKNDITEP
ncbi:MAG: conjugal transfer protein TraD, partial [Lactococcus garvieae]